MSNLYNGVIAYPGTTTVTPQIPTPENLPPRGGSSFKLSGNMWGAIAGAASGILGLFGNKKNNDAIAAENEKNRQWQAEQATIAFNRQRQLTKEQNEWNSYKNQRKLMEEAGYNPNLMVSGTAGVSQSNSSTNAPQANTPVTGMPSSVMSPEVINTLANASLLDSERRKNDAEINLIGSQNINQQLQNFYDTVRNNSAELEKKLDLGLKEISITLSSSQVSLNKILEDLNRYDLNNLKPAQVNNILADTVAKETQAGLNRALEAKTKSDQELSWKQYSLQTGLIFSVIAVNRANAAYLGQKRINESVGGVLHNLWGMQSFTSHQQGRMFGANTSMTYFERDKAKNLFESLRGNFVKYLNTYYNVAGSRLSTFRTDTDNVFYNVFSTALNVGGITLGNKFLSPSLPSPASSPF